MKVSTVSCCPCSWPYFLTLSYISGRKSHHHHQPSMEESVKPATLPLKSVSHQAVCTPAPSDESVKSPNMSTDSGFEGENNPPSKEDFEAAKNPGGGGGADDVSSDFNESPFDKKSVPDSDGEGRGFSAFSVCLAAGGGGNDAPGHVEFGECLTCHKMHYIRCKNCSDCTECCRDDKWCGMLSSIDECRDHVIYAESEDDDYCCKPDTSETDTSEEKAFDATYSDDTLSAYYVPSNEEYHLSVKLPAEEPICEDDESEREDGPAAVAGEREYTTVVKPTAVRPPAAVNLGRAESLHGQHVVAVIGQHHSAFHERPASGLSQHEYHLFGGRAESPAAPHDVDEPASIASASESPHTRAKRFSMPWDLFSKSADGTGTPTTARGYDPNSEPIHMTLEEVHSSLGARSSSRSVQSAESKSSLGFLGSYLRQKKCRKEERSQEPQQKYHRRSFPVIVRSALNNFFGLKKTTSTQGSTPRKPVEEQPGADTKRAGSPNTSPFTNRALPPLPVVNRVPPEWDGTAEDEPWMLDGGQSQIYDQESHEDLVRRKMDYAASIERVKDCGWYWGPISGETAEKLLAGEPDGSFVVRDSSDEHYIFSLTFKLNGLVRHVRIEHDHGNFSFGCLQKFRSNTIVDFIDSAVAHSRSGRYLFFLHRRPILGPMRVQLLHPVSRFKQVQSLQHMCRFIILKTLRRDLIEFLPLPRRLKDYLNTPHYYSEELATQSLLTRGAPTSRPPSGSSAASTPRADSVPPSSCG